jgi:hypothetical protein
LRETIGPSLWAAAVVAVVSLILISIVAVAHFWQDVPMGDLTRDPNAVSECPPYTGFLSQAGLFFWSASVGVCLLSALLAWVGRRPTKVRAFFIASGLITLMLYVDDAYMVHESLLPHLGIPEEAAYATYLLLVAAYLVYFARMILRSDFSVLAVALLFFAVSIVGDELDLPYELGRYFLEDSAKLVGAVSWSAYFVLTGVRMDRLMPVSGATPEPAGPAAV